MRAARAFGGATLALALTAPARAGDGAVLLRAASLAYPRAGIADASVARACGVRFVLGAGGVPAEVTATTCDPAVERVTIRRARRWRWDPATAPGTIVEATVQYAPPLDQAPWPTAQTWRRLASPTCAAHIAIAPDGAAHVRRASDPGCAVSWTAPLSTLEPDVRSRRPWMGEPLPRACAVTFLVRDGAAFAPDLFRCDPDLREASLSALSALAFEDGAGVAPWSLWIEFSPRDRSGEPIVEPTIVGPDAP
jgi:hypothetical protein